MEFGSAMRISAVLNCNGACTARAHAGAQQLDRESERTPAPARVRARSTPIERPGPTRGALARVRAQQLDRERETRRGERSAPGAAAARAHRGSKEGAGRRGANLSGEMAVTIFGRETRVPERGRRRRAA